MGLSFLTLVFRTSGVSPTPSNYDKIFFAFSFAHLVIVGGQSVTYWRSRGKSSFHQNIMAISVIMIYFGYVVFMMYANVCQQNFATLVERATPKVPSFKRDSKSLFFMLLVYFLAFFMVCATLMHSGSNLNTSVPRCINLHLFGVPSVQFCVVANILHERFFSVNTRLRGSMKNKNTAHLSLVRAEITALFKEHVQLRTLIRDVSVYFSFYHMLNIIGRLVFITANLYTVLLSFSDRNHQLNVSDCTSVLYQFVVLALQCISATRCVAQANETVDIAHGFVDPESPLDLIRDVADFSMYMIKNPVEFSVAGVFTISNSILTRGTGLTITYLIIAIQLGSL